VSLIDISGPIYSGMWYYGKPYLDLPVGGVDIHQVEMPEKYRANLFMEYVSMCSQTGTYLETAAHAIAGRETIEQVPLQRVWMVPTVVIHTPKGEREKVTRSPSCAPCSLTSARASSRTLSSCAGCTRTGPSV
jgi:kynurenine formamidase